MKHTTIVILLFGLSACPLAYAAPSAAMLSELQTAAREFDEAQAARAADPARARQLFTSAAQRFESLLAAGVDNGYLQYNLGNAYLQLGDLGRAILHYRRAQRLIPGDPLLAENLGVARARSLLTIAPTRHNAILQTVFFWHGGTSPVSRLIVAIGAYVVFWILLSFRAFFRLPGLTWGAVVSFLLALASGGSLAVQQWQDRTAPDAVILESDVTVYKGPGTAYQKQFEQPLQAGVECRVREVRGEWREIELSDGSTGWVPQSAIELVPWTPPASQATLLAS